MRKTLVLTVGDSTGIGPEITVKLLSSKRFSDLNNLRLIVIGDIIKLQETAQSLGFVLPKSSSSAAVSVVDYVHAKGGLPGAQVFDSLDKAVCLIARGEAEALVTGPISKENLSDAGVMSQGHTEILQHLVNTYYPPKTTLPQGGLLDWQSDMLFVYQAFRVLLLTRHVPLSDVSTELNLTQVIRSLTNSIEFMKSTAGIELPRVCMLGVNPHAGEIGGLEERTVLEPAIQEIKEKYSLEITQPLPADAVFRGFDVTNPPYDLYVAAYHDQGLIPVKLLAGLKAINITIGLPFLRTSVSHGMAMDIVGQGVADESSLWAALNTAQDLLQATNSPAKQTLLPTS